MQVAVTLNKLTLTSEVSTQLITLIATELGIGTFQRYGYFAASQFACHSAPICSNGLLSLQLGHIRDARDGAWTVALTVALTVFRSEPIILADVLTS